jgi:hypothetical protein
MTWMNGLFLKLSTTNIATKRIRLSGVIDKSWTSGST